MQGLVLLDPSFHPRASWELTAVLVLLSGHWPARGLLSGKWPLTPDSQGRSNGNGLAKESTTRLQLGKMVACSEAQMAMQPARLEGMAPSMLDRLVDRRATSAPCSGSQAHTVCLSSLATGPC